jgi:hypothetical protein
MLTVPRIEPNGNLLHKARCFIGDILRDNTGLALIEFAYVLPIFVGFGLVGLEFTNVVLVRQKTERVASTIADQVATNQVAPNERQMGDMFAAVENISEPFGFGAEGNVMVTAIIGIYNDDAQELQNKIAWQRCFTPDMHTSEVGSQWRDTDDIADGPEVSLPNSVELGKNQMVIVAEVFFPYEPIISRSIVASIVPQDMIFRERAMYRTRGQAIMNVTPVAGQSEHVCSAG